MSFALDLQNFAKKAGARADHAVGGIVVAIINKVDERSPVGDAKYWKHPPPKGYVGGHFRANNQIGVGSAPGGVIAGVDPSGDRVRARFSAAVPEDAAGKVYWLVNNTPYGRRLENGWSRQAPQGVYALTVLEFDAFVAAAVADAKVAIP